MLSTSEFRNWTLTRTCGLFVGATVRESFGGGSSNPKEVRVALSFSPNRSHELWTKATIEYRVPVYFSEWCNCRPSIMATVPDFPGGVRNDRDGTHKDPPVKSPRMSMAERPTLFLSVCGSETVFLLNCNDDHTNPWIPRLRMAWLIMIVACFCLRETQ